MKSLMLVLAFSAALSAQSVEGDVVDGVTGAPVEGAYVSSQGTNSGSIVSRTDAAGHFHLVGPSRPSGLQVARTGYLRVNSWVSAQSSPEASGVRITLTPEAVMSGTVRDEDGFPVASASVQAVRYRLVNGERQLQQAASTQSDDLGQFRLAGLPAGRYRIAVTPRGDWDRRYVPLFFPGGIKPGDTDLFEVQAGQQLGGIELRLTKYEGVSVTGRVVNPDGAPALGSVLLSLQQRGVVFSHNYAQMRRDGSFTIRHVPPGSYVLGAQPSGSQRRVGDLAAQQQLQVSGSGVDGLVLTLHEIQAVDLSGTIVVEGGGKPRPTWIGLQGGGGGVSALSNEDGSFLLKGLLPGRYSLQVWPKVVNGEVRAPAGTAISARLGEKEVLREGFDLDGPAPGPLRITLSPRPILASGVLLDAAGRPVAGAMGTLMSIGQPVSPASFQTDSKGAFYVSAPAAGEFRVFVAPDRNQTEAFSDPDFIEAHKEDYPPVRLADGPNPALTLRMPAK